LVIDIEFFENLESLILSGEEVWEVLEFNGNDILIVMLNLFQHLLVSASICFSILDPEINSG